MALLPTPFADLEPFAAVWCLPTEGERYDRRLASTMDELQAFYDACFPRVEEAIAPSPYVLQGIVVGQDRKTLACLVSPRVEEIEKRLPEVKGLSPAALADRADVLALVKEDVARRTGAGSGLKPFEVVSRVALLPEPLSLENGCMTATLKPKRHEIVKRFADRIEAAYR